MKTVLATLALVATASAASAGSYIGVESQGVANYDRTVGVQSIYIGNEVDVTDRLNIDTRVDFAYGHASDLTSAYGYSIGGKVNYEMTENSEIYGGISWTDIGLVEQSQAVIGLRYNF